MRLVRVRPPARTEIDEIKHRILEFRKLDGKKLVTSDGFRLGEVEGAHVDVDNWTVKRLSIGLTDEATKELGFKKPFMGSVKLCLPVNIVQGVGEFITLNKSLRDLKQLPECKQYK